MALGMSKLCNRSSSSGNRARRSGQCLGANEIRNCPRIRPCPPRVPKTSGSQSTYLVSWSLHQNDLGREIDRQTYLYSAYKFKRVTKRLQRIPKIWRQAKIIALVKPGKDAHLAAGYWPISLLSICYKLLECTVFQRISPTMKDLLSIDQDGFRRVCTTCDQVTVLITFIENGFEKTLKTGAVLLDVIAPYDTIWHIGVLYKLSRYLPLCAFRQ